MHAQTLVALTPLVLLAAAGPTTPAPAPTPTRIETNDNLRAAGTLRDGVLRLRLEARVGIWYPEAADGPGAPMQAFGEPGRAPQIPGPMIRVPAGTEVEVAVTNAVPSAVLTMRGLVDRPYAGAAAADTQFVAPGATRVVRFRLNAPGTYYYWGTTSGRRMGMRFREDAQLTGAIVVDPPGADPRRDRVMVIGAWADTNGAAQAFVRGRELVVVNGRSWPHTTRLAYTAGDTVRWRVINASSDIHPMHLHGFYFRVDGRGNGLVDSTYDEARRDQVVTELLNEGRTMDISWVPERAGNWLFHCHIPGHFTARGPLGAEPGAAASAEHANHLANHALQGMGGLLVGVIVAPARGARALAAAPDPARRRLRLLVRENAGGSAESPRYAFTLLEGGAEPPTDTGVHVGPPIVLVRGEPVGITVVNRTPAPTAVHWHGIELESYFDGVAGFSGSAARLSPAIAPGDSFEARFTPPRAGTFIYHTHVDELRQQPAGLAGAIVVLERGQRWDPTTDIPVVVTTPRDTVRPQRAVLINGSAAPAPLELHAGVRYRLRLINITTTRPGLRLDLRRDTTVVPWRLLAKDGAELPAARQTLRPARQPLSIGETMDVEVMAREPGTLRLEAHAANGALLTVLPVHVAAAEAGSGR